jgi:hypothetical protein
MRFAKDSDVIPPVRRNGAGRVLSIIILKCPTTVLLLLAAATVWGNSEQIEWRAGVTRACFGRHEPNTFKSNVYRNPPTLK